MVSIFLICDYVKNDGHYLFYQTEWISNLRLGRRNETTKVSKNQLIVVGMGGLRFAVVLVSKFMVNFINQIFDNSFAYQAINVWTFAFCKADILSNLLEM